MPRIVFEYRKVLVGGGVRRLRPAWLVALRQVCVKLNVHSAFGGFIKRNEGKDVGVEPGEPPHGD